MEGESTIAKLKQRIAALYINPSHVVEPHWGSLAAALAGRHGSLGRRDCQGKTILIIIYQLKRHLLVSLTTEMHYGRGDGCSY